MSFIRDYKLIGQKMHEKKIRFYQVFDGDKSTIIDESTDDENLTVEQAVNDLMETLGNLSGLVYVVIRRDDAPAKRRLTENKATQSGDLYKGIYRYSVKIGNESESGGGYMGGNSGMFDRLLKLQDEKHQLQLNHFKEMAELEKRFSERLEKLEKKEKGGGISEAMEQQIFSLLSKINSRNG
jgi:hypothetical protein